MKSSPSSKHEDNRPERQLIQCNGVSVFLVRIAAPAATRSAAAVQLQRQAAREALRLCAEECAAPLDGWTQRPDGAPIALNGWHWSISHKRRWAGAVISREPIGLDIEAILPRKVVLFDQIATDREWELISGRTWANFFQLWTAKEATLKANGFGIGAMNECHIRKFSAESHLVMTFRGKEWRVAHFLFDDHIAAVSRTAALP